MKNKEYIERGALLQKNMYGNTAPITHRTYAEQLISAAPAADVVDVVHGVWKFGAFDVLGSSVQCSVCGWGAEYANEKTWLKFPGHNFCGHCGAKMDGGKYETD